MSITDAYKYSTSLDNLELNTMCWNKAAGRGLGCVLDRPNRILGEKVNRMWLAYTEMQLS